MNSIQKAFENQGLDIAWKGDEPTCASKITKSYIETHMIFSDDKKHKVNIGKLKIDFKKILEDKNNNERIMLITNYTEELILKYVSVNEQTDMIMTAIQINSNKTSKKADTILKEIFDIWQWIKDIRSQSVTAIKDNTAFNDIKWSEFKG